MSLHKKWEIEVDGQHHLVEIKNSFWLALLIYVDGELVRRARGLPPVVGDFPIILGSKEAVLRIRDLATFVDYTVCIDGRFYEETPRR